MAEKEKTIFDNDLKRNKNLYNLILSIFGKVIK